MGRKRNSPKKPGTPKKLCQKCGVRNAIRMSRFCIGCREIALNDMEKVGYIKTSDVESRRATALKSDVLTLKLQRGRG
jgi:hypothetical protein